MNTQNVNVKTATRKSTERYDEEIISVEARAKQIIEAAQPKLKTGCCVAIAADSKHGQQIEIRCEGRLVWRAWTFESGFIADLTLQIGFVKNAE
jgi:hypothetical protein